MQCALASNPFCTQYYWLTRRLRLRQLHSRLKLDFHFHFSLVASQTSFLSQVDILTRTENFSQNDRPTALSGLREDRPQYILKTRIIELQTSFCLRKFFAETLRKWRLILLPRYISLTRKASAIGERCEWKSSLNLCFLMVCVKKL